MEKQKNKTDWKNALFIQWVFFCLYWGVYAILWHFATYINSGSTPVLFEAAIFTPICSIAFYLTGAFLMFLKNCEATSQSSEPSDKQS